MPNPVEIQLPEEYISYARMIAQARHDSGGPSNPPDGNGDPLQVDLLGTMSEAAVCLAYGFSPEDHVLAHKERPRGDYTDLHLFGYKVGVKATARFEDPVHLMVPEYDTACDFYMHCSVNTETGLVWINGMTTREVLLKRKPEEWKWTRDRRGYKKPSKLRRYVNRDELLQCQPTSHGKVLKLGKVRKGMRTQ